jgi:hypothetical protein
MVLIPTKLIRAAPKIRRRPYMDNAEITVPAREKKKIYEKSVPVIRACPRILIPTRSTNTAKGKISKASIRGRFAIPIRMKGKGLGIIYSIVERNKQKAPKSAASCLYLLNPPDLKILPG